LGGISCCDASLFDGKTFSRIIFQAFFVATVQKLAKKKNEILIYTLKNSPKKSLKANNNATRYQSFFFCKLL